MIGIAPPYKTELVHYTSWLTRRNLEHRVLEPGDDLKGISLLLLCGGADLGKRPERDEREFTWFKECYGRVPIFGICRGMQLANVVLGGTLFENIQSDKTKHRGKKKEIAPDAHVTESRFHMVSQAGSLYRVNSRHHQAIEKLAMGIVPFAWSKEDAIIEGAYGDFSMFVQWHPEREEVFDTECEIMCSNWIRKFMTCEASPKTT